MANKIGSRILKIHCKLYEGDVHGTDYYNLVSLWDAESNNDFEETFVLEQWEEQLPDMIVTVEEYVPVKYDMLDRFGFTPRV